MTQDGLEPLYKTTVDLFSDPDALSAGLDWVDRVLPLFTEACVHEVTNGSPETLTKWREWLEGEGVERIRDAGEPDSFAWRHAWLTLVVFIAEELQRGGMYKSDVDRCSLVNALNARRPAPFGAFPKGFWCELVDGLAGKPRPARIERKIVSGFPLVLSERMVVDGDNIDVLMSDFILEPTPYESDGPYLHPFQIAVRCIDPQFISTFTNAAAVLRELAPGLTAGARVRLYPRSPKHEVFLRKLILRGPSGGGALAAGLCALNELAKPPSPEFATSFALTAPGKSETDGRCHAIGGAYEKVRGCAKAGISRLMVAEEQASQVRFYGHLQKVEIIGVPTIQEAIGVLDRPSSTSQNDAAEAARTQAQTVPGPSRLYLERKSDTAFQAALSQRPMIVLVKGPRQIGKTSLLVRGVEQVRQQNVKLVYVDMSSIEREGLKTQKDLFLALARIFTRELKLDVTMADIYDERDGPNKNFENFLFRYALGSPVIWFMDEVDRLFEFDYYTDVFSLMRSWHNRRPIHPELANLTLVLCYATETHLLIEDAYQSPFNVGTKIDLEDFTPEQISEINTQFGKPLKSKDELERFYDLVGGHPYLVTKGTSWMAEEHKSLDEFISVAALDSEPYGPHLRHLRQLARSPEQLELVRTILSGGVSRNNDAFLHLRSAGVLVGDDSLRAHIRCEIYSDYLRRYLDMPAAGSKEAKQGKRDSFWQSILGNKR